MKETFCCGLCTSSRIESKHRIYKKYLNGSKRLCELFKVFKELEQQEVLKFCEEIRSSKKKGTKCLDGYKALSDIKQNYSNYCLNILNKNLIEALNYQIEARRDFW